MKSTGVAGGADWWLVRCLFPFIVVSNLIQFEFLLIVCLVFGLSKIVSEM